LGLRVPTLDEAKLLEAARAKTGLDDFGGEAFREGLRRALRALEGEAQLNLIGRVATRGTLAHLLETRLKLQAYRKQHPELEAEEIRRPVFIVGVPRTGTTILFNLLAQDPANRAPLSWEIENPCPPPEEATFTTDPRIAQMEKQFAGLEKVSPTLSAIHEFGAELPQECIAITAHEFLTVQFHIVYNALSYQQWLDEQSLVPAFEYHRRYLQHLQSRYKKERWVLKTPGHLPVIDDLLTVYPDACIIHTHRDPLRVMPSVASLSYALRQIYTDAIDPHFVGQQQVDLWERNLNRAMRARQRLHDRNEQFFDTQFEDVVKDPIGVIERIYSHFKLPFTPEAHRRMRAFLEANPRERLGPHKYSLEDFGLDPQDLQVRFRDYCENFDIPTGTHL